MIPYERERSLEDADRIIRACIARRGWCIDTDRLGEGLVTAKCFLLDGDGQVLAFGGGKGEPDAAYTGAVYEAVEHHYCKAATLPQQWDYRSAQSIAQDPRYAALPFLSAFAEQPQRRLACRSYAAYDDGDALPVPLFLSFPDYPGSPRAIDPRDDFDYTSALRFGSNSGTAIGASFEEAALHGIGEIVERDAWSLFLIAHHLGGDIAYGRWIAPASLPEELARAHRIAEARLGCGLRLIDMTTDLAYPAFIAVAERRLEDEVVFSYGCGASPYPRHAALRALSELVQCVDIKRDTEHLAGLDRLSLELLAAYPRLRDCAMGEIDPRRLHRAAWDYAEPARATPQQLLPAVVADLRARGLPLYYAINHREADDFWVVSSLSPDLERFFLVTTGVAMAPGRRGQAFLRRHRRAEAGAGERELPAEA
ncbi:ribosomal protein S12 methylthiotransferase accessory factor [Lysobacter sp. yr284]|uniref:YcaO-like family protein n=1 Tax=Lysobacter sp. yr284 TaxID=1761791 RepID=UPI00089871CB|nr:YcaO-like family protein [Lysobacter sp. yr284]SDY78033.1 ribosomal protein S12 methylthiotransferase accessory factor [Lysobacter sp. yr284]